MERDLEHAEPEDRQAAVDAWHRYWADRSPELAQYLAALAGIEKTGITGSVDSAGNATAPASEDASTASSRADRPDDRAACTWGREASTASPKTSAARSAALTTDGISAVVTTSPISPT